MKIINLVLFWIFSLSSLSINAQQLETSKKAALQIDDSSKIQAVHAQKDLLEIIGEYIHPKKASAKDPEKAQFSAVPAAGYAMHTGWAGLVTANLAFYTSKNYSTDKKVSSIATNITYSQYKQLMLPVQANIWTNKNKFNILLDWRYIKYPSKVFDLGSDSKESSGYLVDYHGIKLHQTVLKSFAPNFYAGLGFYYDRLWNINEVDPPANSVTSFQSYGFQKTVTASGPVLKLLYDSRLNTINPQNGLQANITYRPSIKTLGSDNNWQSLQLEFRKYLHPSSNSKNILALWSHNWFTLGGKPPYLMLPSTGWDDSYNSGRGYIQGRYRAQNMIYLESEYRFQISSNGLIGGVVFVNGQTFSEHISRGYQGFIPGYGLGLRIKLNKYSGANVCIDYGFGRDGSRGFAVNLGELF